MCRQRASVRVCGAAVLSVCAFASAARAQAAATSRTPQAQGAAEEWTLAQVVTAALSQHPLVEAARARVDAARGAQMTAGALANPVWTFWVENAGYPGQDAQALPLETSTYLTWPLEPLVHRSARRRRAAEELKFSEASFALARRHVAQTAARAFFRLALAQELAEEADHERGMLDQLAAYTRARVQEGVTAEVEILRIEVELDRAATDVALADADLKRGTAELAPYLRLHATGLAPVRVVMPAITGSRSPSLPPLGGLVVQAQQRRAELIAARARVAASAAAVDYERALAVRQFGATFGNKRTAGQNSMIAGFSVAIPLFTLNRGGVAQAMSDRTAAEHDLAWTDRSVIAGIEGAYTTATRLTSQVSALQRSFLATADQVHRLTLGAYLEGGATLLQVLDATRMLADARLTFARALLAQRESVFELALATGAEPAEAIDLLRTWSSAASLAAQGGSR